MLEQAILNLYLLSCQVPVGLCLPEIKPLLWASHLSKNLLKTLWAIGKGLEPRAKP
jgi:hypothetical protein